MHEHKKKRIDWWNLAFSLFFILLMYWGYTIVTTFDGVPRSVSVWDATLMTLATFRLTRLAVYDSITRWVRDFFDDAKEFTFFGTIKTLVNCPWCMALWFALIVATAYFTSPFLWFFIFVLALGGAASFIQIVANGVGWSAEHRKKKVLNNQ